MEQDNIAVIEVMTDRSILRSGRPSAASLREIVIRAQQVSLWNYILTVSQQPASSAGRTRVAEFKAHLQKFFAPRDCAHVNPESP